MKSAVANVWHSRRISYIFARAHVLWWNASTQHVQQALASHALLVSSWITAWAGSVFVVNICKQIEVDTHSVGLSRCMTRSSDDLGSFGAGIECASSLAWCSPRGCSYNPVMASPTCCPHSLNATNLPTRGSTTLKLASSNSKVTPKTLYLHSPEQLTRVT